MTLAQFITAVYQQGYRDGADDIDDVKADLFDLEQRFAAVTRERAA